jgi:hypothetical protein
LKAEDSPARLPNCRAVDTKTKISSASAKKEDTKARLAYNKQTGHGSLFVDAFSH